MQKVQEAEGYGARALEFTILTAARCGETLGALWSEINLDTAVWTIPPERVKAGKEHVVPLSGRALVILRQMYDARQSQWVFPGRSPKTPLSNMSLTMTMRRLAAAEFTVHGFRSAFRDWCGDATSFPRDVAEMALAHKVGDDVEEAYRRGSALAKRRKLMEAWAGFCVTTKRHHNVVAMGRTV